MLSHKLHTGGIRLQSRYRTCNIQALALTCMLDSAVSEMYDLESCRVAGHLHKQNAQFGSAGRFGISEASCAFSPGKQQHSISPSTSSPTISLAPSRSDRQSNAPCRISLHKERLWEVVVMRIPLGESRCCLTHDRVNLLGSSILRRSAHRESKLKHHCQCH